MTTKIKATDLILGARKLAELYPNGVYDPGDIDSCLYDRGTVIDGPPVEGCILGQAMREVSHKFFMEHHHSACSIHKEEFETVITGTENQKDWLAEVQAAQDSGVAWGKAVARANKEHPVRIRKAKPAPTPEVAPA